MRKQHKRLNFFRLLPNFSSFYRRSHVAYLPQRILMETEMSKTLDDRIADACTNEMSSEALKSLLEEVSQVDAKAKAESEAASKIAFDPAVRPAKVEEARKAMDDANFRAQRMSAATERLTERMEDARAREKAALLKKKQDDAIAERDQLVSDLQAYDKLAAQIGELLDRLAANNSKLIEAFGLTGEFQSAEITARGMTAELVTRPGIDNPTLIHGVRLPNFRGPGYRWPARNPHF
jgi:hypothetical protein